MSKNASSSQFALMHQQRFAPFFWTQFFGAMNDNVFKITFTGLVTYYVHLFNGVPAQTAAFVISALFIAPFVFFSAIAGQISDKFDKAVLMRWVKNFEIAIMLLACTGFILHNLFVLYTCTFLMGLHSTIFGPVKYAYLPQHLNEQELTGGNGMVEMGTFVAILLGTIIGGLLINLPQQIFWISAICLLLAVVGRWVAQKIPVSIPDQPQLRIQLNPFSSTWSTLKLALKQRTVFLSMLGISWMWFFGATFLTSFFAFSKDVLAGNTEVVTLLLALFSIGIACGALLCERLSGKHIEIGLVPFGSIGMSVFAIDLYWACQHLLVPDHTHLMGALEFLKQSQHWRIMFDLLLLAMFAGFYSVPLYALIQIRSPKTHRARIIAANNILNAVFMIFSSLLAMGLLHAGYSIPQLFLITGLLNAAVALYIYLLVPEFLVRFLAWLLIHSIYKVKSEGTENIPQQGAAILACNHVSFVDAVVVMALVQRPIRFVMDYRISSIPILAFIFRRVKVIPIASAQENMKMLKRANHLIDQALAHGELVCIFPEGRITDTGELYPFKSGVQKIAQRNQVPVYPMALRGLWGSFFSRFGGRAFTTIPRPLRQGFQSQVELIVGEKIRAEELDTESLQTRIQQLRGEYR